MFKRKTWIEVSRYYTPPVYVDKVRGITEDTLRKMLNGFTTVELRCNETGELRFYEEYGDLR